MNKLDATQKNNKPRKLTEKELEHISGGAPGLVQILLGLALSIIPSKIGKDRNNN